MISVYVFHNERRLAMHDGFKPEDSLRFVYRTEVDVEADYSELDMESFLSLARSVTAKLNVEPPKDYKLRSLSVGDALMFVDPKDPTGSRLALAIEPIGYRLLVSTTLDGAYLQAA